MILELIAQDCGQQRQLNAAEDTSITVLAEGTATSHFLGL
jgi:hypothetical protein